MARESTQCRYVGAGAVGQATVQVLLGGVARATLEDRPEVLGVDPTQPDLLVDFAAGERGEQPGPASVGERVVAAAEQSPDPEQGVVAAAAVPGRVLLDPAAHVVHADKKALPVRPSTRH